MDDKEKEMLKEEKQKMYRHSMSHVMAKAIKQIYGDVKFAIGPSIDNGFYYDIDMEQNLTPDDADKIEAKMQEIINSNQDFVRKEVSKKKR